MFRKLFLTAAVAIALMSLSSTTRADVINIGPGQFGSTATVSNYSLSGNLFTFTVTNTSSTGAITALGFDLPGANRGTFTLTASSDPDFKVQSAVKTQAGANTSSSNFDFALLTGKNFGGGSVAAGIGAGSSVTFTVSGNFNGLTANQIAQSIFLRFQGIGARDFSEVIGPGNPPTTPVPEPMTMLLLGTGLAGTAANIRRRRKAAEKTN